MATYFHCLTKQTVIPSLETELAVLSIYQKTEYFLHTRYKDSRYVIFGPRNYTEIYMKYILT